MAFFCAKCLGLVEFCKLAQSNLTSNHQICIILETQAVDFVGFNKKMTKSELIAKLAANNPDLYYRDVERLVNTIFDKIIEALENGDRVELRGFGAFSVRHHDARIGRNPRTGEAVEVASKKVPFFKMGKGMQERLNR